MQHKIHSFLSPDLLVVVDGNGLVSELCRQKFMFIVKRFKTEKSDTSGESVEDYSHVFL